MITRGCEGASVPRGDCSPRDFLLSNASGTTEDWHKFGMEWKAIAGLFGALITKTSPII